MKDITVEIEPLLEKPCWLIDTFPYTVPQKPDGRYFGVEEYLRTHDRKRKEAFCRLLLKLYCWYDITLAAGEEVLENPLPPQLAEAVELCLEDGRQSLDLLLPEVPALIALDGDDLSLRLYGPDEKLLDLAKKLAGSEGLFVYPAPGQ